MVLGNVLKSLLFNRGCLVYMFSLCFSGSKFLLNLRRQFRVRKIFLYTRFCGIYALFILCVFKITISKMRNLSCRSLLFINTLSTSPFVLVNGIVLVKCLIILCLTARIKRIKFDELKEVNYFKEITDFKNL